MSTTLLSTINHTTVVSLVGGGGGGGEEEERRRDGSGRDEMSGKKNYSKKEMKIRIQRHIVRVHLRGAKTEIYHR